MAKIIPCPYCFGEVMLGVGTCPHCKKDLHNRNPQGALPFGMQLAERYTIGDYQFADGEGLTYRAVDNEARAFLTIKEYFPVTLSSGRARDGSIRPKAGSEVLFKTARMDFLDLYETLEDLTPATGLVTVLDVLETNNTAYAVMENAKGVTLTRYLKLNQKPLTLNQVTEILTPVLEGVNYLHKNGMIHRGICPDNILLPIDGAARLTGYATLGLRTAGSEIKAKLYGGYSAPEQYSAAEFEGNYTDVYALCAVIYRMLSGRVPATALQRRELQRQQKETLIPLTQLNGAVPAYYAKVVACGLRLNSEKRLQTIPELVSGLSNKEDAQAMFTHVRSTGRMSTKRLLGGFAVVLTVLILLALWVLLGRNRAKKPAESQSESVSTSSQVESVASVYTEIPNFVGMPIADVRYNEEYLANFRFTITSVEDANAEEGTILSQTPDAGTALTESKPTVQLVISKGASQVTMPSIVGYTQEQAEGVLRENGITYSILTLLNNGEYTEGCVAECSVPPGTEFDPANTRVSVYVAGAVQEVVVPDENDNQENVSMDGNGESDNKENTDNEEG